jgi:hypothetical protein
MTPLEAAANSTSRSDGEGASNVTRFVDAPKNPETTRLMACLPLDSTSREPRYAFRAADPDTGVSLFLPPTKYSVD